MKLNQRNEAHLQAVIELVELISIASLIALYGDALWIVRDMITNGITPCLAIICILLWTATGLMTIGVYKYHMKAVEKFLRRKTRVERRKVTRDEWQS